MSNLNHEENEPSKNAPFRSARRAARHGRPMKSGQRRRLTVRSELRDGPDVQKLARAVISMALVEAERETQARAERDIKDAADD